MSEGERIARMRTMRRSIRRHDVFAWVDSFLQASIARELRDFPAPPRASADDPLWEQLPI
jgi:trehalose 6-phosphate synthase